MNSICDITNKLKDALKMSCNDAFYFSDDETRLIDAEYLVTVNSAKSIKELNHYFGMPYKIFLEHDTEKFATACTPLFGNQIDDINYPVRTSNNTVRSGKIDIAIYSTDNPIDVPLCAIEVKGFNPRKGNIIDDLKRNAEYFSISSPTGVSNLPFTIFMALHSYKKTMTNQKECSNIRRLRKRYDKYMDDISLPSDVSHRIEILTIRRGIMPAPNDPFTKEMGLQGNEDYHFVGAIVSFQRKNQHHVQQDVIY